ncbi:hypothetical protein ACFXKC_12240 [Streptomyces sp. NPDC059340]|uniref:hypothetical protein n=1 Tax=Streptomyces sp. NPDC059340 TaxID=3346806 RepID=UPI0036C22F18
MAPGPARSSSAFADAVVLVVSELTVTVLRHAPRSPVADVGMTVGAGRLVVSVAGAEPHLPGFEPGATGAGLQLVAELAAGSDGDVSTWRSRDVGRRHCE